jgi:hypothetical protein
MAVILLRGGEKYYASGTGRVTNQDRQRADQLDDELKHKLMAYEKEALRKKYILPNGTKKDALRIWYDIGKLLNDIANKYGILGTSDEHYYWQAIYNHISPLIQRAGPPQSSSGNKNHFRLCAYMASKGNWEFVSSIGNWSVWRDLLDNSRLQEDQRIFDWVVSSIHESGFGHKEVRPFVHEVRRSLKNKDTSVLSDKELFAKLRPLASLIPENK